MLKLPARLLSLLAYFHDAIAVVFAWWVAFLFRFNFHVPPAYLGYLLESLPIIFILHSVCFYSFGLYRGLWRFASLPDLKRIVRAIAFGALLTVSFALVIHPEIIIPRSVLFIHPMLLVILMGGSRFVYRAWKERRMFNSVAAQGKPVIVIGVEDSSLNLIKELSKSPEWRVVAMIDPNKKLVGREIMHTKVEGGLQDIPRIAQRYDCKHCMIAMPGSRHEKRRAAVEAARQVEGMEVLTLPAMSDLISGRVSLSQIRRIDVEDLLGRDVVQLDTHGLSAMLANKVVLVSGAAGSIGSELCRQILSFHPAQLVCLDISEYALYTLQQEFNQLVTETELVYVVADVKNQVRMQRILQSHQPDVVLHAGAYKHVPMMEHFNVVEALQNNAYGTYQIAAACQAVRVPTFVLVSTDKAVNPTNVMGASKRLAELICQGLQHQKHSPTRFITVRFGNVLGSSGSVIPKFREQIAHGGPITITHPEITRYFMSIPEAAQLVLQAATMGNGGEVFVLDMGTPVRIIDLARDMIKLSGLQEQDIRIEFTGLRPGEKLYEELLADDENTLPTSHEKLRIAQARSADGAWLASLLEWLTLTPNMTEEQIKQGLQRWVQEYQPDTRPAPSISLRVKDMSTENIHAPSPSQQLH
ncbi:NDP-sugar epimerase, includes UDP-GlcNAc-inverting 4,6-dehydratase FlaA1 and capsular polysaccharide biosynthesis protein EpsC [Methylophilus rhizosphaerae]|uniref:NDP-sugar epimerase, includes UDP-GlcNAc-inverting 4,6-dehydratase FlaA1 and capsular polysaccharide biosynthesis protein EpsC n=1 Tax=Methylophilus rhizosphaerae TaxID=492660 RepID=A0A1G8ZDG5_9PROT|nr:nucleoside-diphosphate sugar epimerase/dehydratase [Methylophilus rhizosphaerae]SDK12220.1 NDP-sugar epimerase, includes UDP-GlcNAc-inverting 4,6-dehydratase FlaA1 and capsular polysaccharide biosynthesis protein EpsC [Methylophilus rhizosphaerae]